MYILKFNELSELWFSKSTNDICYSYKIELKALIKHMNNHLGEKHIHEIYPIDITNMVISLSNNNPNTDKPMAKQTLSTLIKTAGRIFEFAIDNGLIDKNPVRGTAKRIPKNAPKKIVSDISKTEQLLIINTPHRCRIAALIMMFMGLRTNELLALRWKNIDLIEKKAYICERAVKDDFNSYIISPDTKNGKSRYVTIPDNLCKLFANELKTAKSEYVFPRTDGTLHTPSSWKSAWRSYMNTINHSYYNHIQNTNLSIHNPKGYPRLIDIKPHQLRHTYATLLYVSGTNVLVASKLLGHSSVQITLDIYTHLDEEYKTLDISNFNSYLSNDLCRV